MNMSYTFWQNVNHRHDDIKYVGYDYRGNIFYKTLSNIFFSEKKRESILLEIDKIFSFLVDHIKHIKKARNYTLPKYYRHFN